MIRAAAAAAAFVVSAVLFGAGVASAWGGPPYPWCGGGGAMTPWGGGSFCDGPRDPVTGSYDHWVLVSVLGFGGWSSGVVCPPDPANPAIPLPFDGRPCPFR